MRDRNGQLLDDGDKIGEACVEYYKELYTPAELPVLNFSMFDDMWHGPFIKEEMRQCLQE